MSANHLKSRLLIPQLIIERAGPLYESKLRISSKKRLSDTLVERRTKLLTKQWKQKGSALLKELTRVTKLIWPDKDIRVYVVTMGLGVSFSHPLTLQAYPSPNDMFDVLTHELIHRLLKHPYKKHPQWYVKSRSNFLAAYTGEAQTIQHHLILNALHAHLILVFFGKARLARSKKFSSNPDYHRAWNIVDHLGHEEILRQVFGKDASKAHKK